MLKKPDPVIPYARPAGVSVKTLWTRLHLDLPLLLLITLLTGFGLIILYSAANQQIAVIRSQLIHFALALAALLVCAQIPPHSYKRWTPLFYYLSVSLLLSVLVIGHIAKGAQRWLDIGILHLQPAELMKLALPMMLAWYLSEKPLPPSLKTLSVSALLIVVPVILTAKQPDLGSAILIAGVGASVMLLTGLSWRIMGASSLAAVALAPVMWLFMHDYQRERVLTFLNPERDPLGAGYHIIQSKIAIGSGGLWGKGWLAGTQSHLAFLPEHHTDFIFAVCGEEFGLVGSVFLILCCLLITARCFFIAAQAQETYTRLLAGTIGCVFFLSAFINIGMVSGALPVVGLPLPLVSYGGSAVVIMLAGFGILMSIHTHRKLLSS